MNFDCAPPENRILLNVVLLLQKLGMRTIFNSDSYGSIYAAGHPGYVFQPKHARFQDFIDFSLQMPELAPSILASLGREMFCILGILECLAAQQV